MFLVLVADRYGDVAKVLFDNYSDAADFLKEEEATGMMNCTLFELKRLEV